METTEITKIPRQQLVDELVARDGTLCQYPGKEHELDFTAEEGPQQVTLDHFIPQAYCKSEGWTHEQTHGIDNLKLMCRKHNAAKGDLSPNEDGTLPEKTTRTFRYRRDKRAARPDLCMQCDNGHNLLVGEFCASCGCDAQRFPRWAKVKANECSHDITWCWACSIGIIERESSIATAIRQADSDELGEWSGE